MDKACELCYVAKKYMLPVVVQRCTEFLWSDLNAKNVCRGNSVLVPCHFPTYFSLYFISTVSF